MPTLCNVFTRFSFALLHGGGAVLPSFPTWVVFISSDYSIGTSFVQVVNLQDADPAGDTVAEGVPDFTESVRWSFPWRPPASSLETTVLYMGNEDKCAAQGGFKTRSVKGIPPIPTAYVADGAALPTFPVSPGRAIDMWLVIA